MKTMILIRAMVDVRCNPALLLVAIGLLDIALLGGQRPCTLRTVPISVSSPNGNIVPELKAEDFRAEIRGKPLDVKAVSPDRGPYRTVLLVDTSGSITQQRKEWRTTAALARDFVDAAPDSLNVALLTFSRAAEARSGFLQDRKVLLQELRQLEEMRWEHVKGVRRTATVDAILRAVSLLDPVRPGDSILLIGDGEDNASTHDQAQVTHALLRTGVRLFAALLDTRLSRFRVRQEDVEWLRRAVNASGGDLLEYFPGQRSGTSLLDILRMMTSFYRLDVNVCDGNNRIVRWKVKISRSGPRAVEEQKFRVVFPKALLVP